MVRNNGIEQDKRIFPISYPAARMVVKKAGKLVGINPWLRPGMLRYGDWKLYTNLQTTQLYLGKISDLEVMRWVDNPHN